MSERSLPALRTNGTEPPGKSPSSVSCPFLLSLYAAPKAESPGEGSSERCLGNDSANFSGTLVHL